MRRIALLVLLVALATPALRAPDQPLLANNPTLSRTHIVFVFAGDLWSVPRAGGAAVRLTTGTGIESRPVLLPDGSQIAFTGEYDGNVDVFVVPAAGGVPRRLTWHPAADNVARLDARRQARPVRSRAQRYSRFSRSVHGRRRGRSSRKLPLPMGYEGSYSPDGARLAYVPLAARIQHWKRYRGGQATPIWIATLADSTSSAAAQRLQRLQPDVDRRHEFTSSRTATARSRCSPTTRQAKKVAQVVENNGLDIKSASARARRDRLRAVRRPVPLRSQERQEHGRRPSRVAGDMPEVREHFVKVGARLHQRRVSPTGVRAVFEARGEILTVPAEKGDVRNLTNTPGVMPNATRPGRPTARPSPTSPTSPASTRCTCAIRTARGEVTKIALGRCRRRSTTRRAGRPTARRSPTPTSAPQPLVRGHRSKEAGAGSTTARRRRQRR